MPSDWSLLTNHGKALAALARRPDLLERELAAEVGVTERAIRGIVADLVEVGYVERIRVGRRNHYAVKIATPIRHPVGAERVVGDLVGVMAPELHPAAAPERPTALVLACTDRRFQEPLRDLLAAEGLIGSAEIVLWPGGGAALSSAEARRLVRLMRNAVADEVPPRLLLVAHEGCKARGAGRPSEDPTRGMRHLSARRRRAIDRIRVDLGVEPEMWFLTSRHAYRAKSKAAFHARPRPVPTGA